MSKRRSHKAASSRLAAASLSRSNSGQSGFASASSFSGSAFSSSLRTQSFEVDDQEINFAFRKLKKKKDPVTKLKALAELRVLFAEDKHTKHTLKPILPAWCYHFNRLALSNDRRVREALHGAFAALAAKVRKALAAHLSELVPHWWMHQHDAWREVVAAAEESFSVTFPTPEKLPEVLAFCKDAVFDKYAEYLHASPHTLSDMRSTSEEDAQERYERVLLSSLTAFGAFVERLPDAARQELAPRFVELFDKKVWKLSRSSVHAVKRGMYVFVTSLVAHMPEFTEAMMPQIARFAFAALTDKQRGNHAAAWDLLLTTVKRCPQVWDHANIEGKVLPTLWAAIRGRAYGSVRRVFSLLLPLLSCVPTPILDSFDGGRSAFFAHFLTCIWDSLTPEEDPAIAAPAKRGTRVGFSTRTETQPIVDAFFECLSFVVSRYAEQEPDVCVALITATVLPRLLTTDEQPDLPRNLPETLGSLLKRTCDKLGDSSDTVWAQVVERAHAVVDADPGQARSISSLLTAAAGDARLVHQLVPFFTHCLEQDLVRLARDLITTHALLDAMSEEQYDALLADHITPLCETLRFEAGRGPSEASCRVVCELLSAVLQRAPTGLAVWDTIFSLASSAQVAPYVRKGLFEVVLAPHTAFHASERMDASATALAHELCAVTSRGKFAADVQTCLRICVTHPLVSEPCRPQLAEVLLPAVADVASPASEAAAGALHYLLSDASLSPALAQRAFIAVFWSSCVPTNANAQLLRSSLTTSAELLPPPRVLELADALRDHASDIDSMLNCEAWADAVEFISSTFSADAHQVINTCLPAHDTIADTVRALGEVARAAEEDRVHNQLRLAVRLYSCLTELESQVGVELFVEDPQRAADALCLNQELSWWADGVAAAARSDIHSTVLANEELLLATARALVAAAPHSTSYVDALRTILSQAPKSVATQLKPQLEDLIRAPCFEGALAAHVLVETGRWWQLDRLRDLLVAKLRESLDQGGDDSAALALLCAALLPACDSPFDAGGLVTAVHASAGFQRLVDGQLGPQQTTQTWGALLRFADTLVAFAVLNSDAIKCVSEWVRHAFALVSAMRSSKDQLWSEILVSPKLLVQVVEPGARCFSTLLLRAALSEAATASLTEATKDVIRLLGSRTFAQFEVGKHARAVEACTDLLVTLAETEDGGTYIPKHRVCAELVDGAGGAVTMGLVRVFGHPIAPLTEAAYRLASLYIRRRVERSVVEGELVVESARAGDADAAAAAAAPPPAPEEIDAELEAKMRVKHEQERLAYEAHERAQLAVLLPHTFQTELTVWPTLQAPAASVEVMIERDALQLRSSLLTWSLLLDVLASVHDPRKKLLLVEFLKASGAVGLACDELFEHVAVAPQARLAAAASLPMWTCEHLVPNCPREGFRPATHTRRLRALRVCCQELELDFAVRDAELYFSSLAALLYMRTLRALPVLARTWWNDVERGASLPISDITSQVFSPLLVQEEIEALESQTSDMGDEEEFRVRGNLRMREISARYSRGDEVRIVLVVSMPEAYPLQPVSVTLAERAGVPESRMRRWQLTTSAILSSQNGSIREAVLLWKKNVDSHFADIEECPICYSIVHASTRQLPRMACSVCRHKFHSACLYKWFSTSGGSKCPLCRNLF